MRGRGLGRGQRLSAIGRKGVDMRLSPATRVAMALFVDAAIRRWEPRVKELAVSIEGSVASGVVRIRVNWRSASAAGAEIFVADSGNMTSLDGV